MRIGGYEIIRKLGQGAFGQVYLARKGEAGGFRSYYALKRLRSEHQGDADFEAYLLREARLGGLVNHPNLVRIHEVLRVDGQYVLVMDYVDGRTLREVLRAFDPEGPRPPLETCLEIGAGVLDALHYIHNLRDPEGNENGFVHRDIKPGNVMLTRGGGLKLMDFGVARDEDAASMTDAGELRGTVAYMAPEQARGEEAAAHSDQFAAGALLRELITGQRIWGRGKAPLLLTRAMEGDTSAAWEDLAQDDPLRPFFQRILHPDPAQRFTHCAEASRALRTIRAHIPVPPTLGDFADRQLGGEAGAGVLTDRSSADWAPLDRTSGSWTSASHNTPSLRARVDDLPDVSAILQESPDGDVSDDEGTAPDHTVPLKTTGQRVTAAPFLGPDAADPGPGPDAPAPAPGPDTLPPGQFATDAQGRPVTAGPVPAVQRPAPPAPAPPAPGLHEQLMQRPAALIGLGALLALLVLLAGRYTALLLAKGQPVDDPLATPAATPTPEPALALSGGTIEFESEPQPAIPTEEPAAAAATPSRRPPVRPQASPRAPAHEDWLPTPTPAPTPADEPPPLHPGEVIDEPTHQDAEPTPGPTPETPTVVEPTLRFLSGSEQPVGAPLQLEVRPEGFRAGSVAVYYEWRSEGRAGRRRRSLTRLADGSFALTIPASELKRDRLRVWFQADPGPVFAGSERSPIEVRVK